jgi:hypothetical protein
MVILDFGRKSKKQKKEMPTYPAVPKGVVTAFGFYSKDNRKRIRTENSLATSTRITELF